MGGVNFVVKRNTIFQRIPVNIELKEQPKIYFEL